MAVQYIQARVTNPGKPGKAARTVSGSKKMAKKKRSGSKKIVISVGARKRNPAKKRSLLARARRGAAKIGSRVKTIVLGAPKKRRSSRKRKANPAKRHALGGIVLHRRGRKHNPRRRRSIKSRRRNPGFDVKSALISGAVLIGGAYLAAKIVPFIESKVSEMAPSLSGKTLGYAMLVGAAATIVGGDYLQRKFGSSKIDLKPATYAIAAAMAVRGLRKAELLGSDAGMLGMGATLDFGPALAYGSRQSNPGLPEGYSMLGSILSNDQLPAPAVGPHNVMQGYGPVLV